MFLYPVVGNHDDGWGDDWYPDPYGNGFCSVFDPFKPMSRLGLQLFGLAPDERVIVERIVDRHQFAERRHEPAAGRIAEETDVGTRGEEPGHQAVERGRVGLDRGLEGEPLADAHHRHAMITDGAADENHVARSR